MEHKNWFKLGTGLTLASLAIACGGGGGSGGESNSNASQKVSTGTFVDASVQGIRYQSGNLSGITDASGTFYYVPGETVTFSIGGLHLGQATGSDMVTPADLLGVDKASQDDALVNMLRLLQTLDTDGDPDNGITIPDSLSDNLEDIELNFNQTTTDFTFDEGLIEWLREHPKQLVSADTALNHFQGTIEREESPSLNDHGRPGENQSAEELLNELDLNGDLALSFEEFKPAIDENEIASITDYFNDVDRDKSGGISLEEFIEDDLDGEFGDCEEHDEFEDDEFEDEFDDDEFEDDDFEDEFDSDEFEDEFENDEFDENDLNLDTSLEAPNSGNPVAGTFDDGANSVEEDFEDESEDEEYITFLTEEFNAYDINSDQILDLDEWITYITSILDEHTREEFDEIDIDTNGVLTLEELEAQPDYGDEEYDDEIFRSLDINNSQAISLDEFLFHVDEAMKPIAEENFYEMDENEDGLLTIDEVQVHRPRNSAQEQIDELKEMDLNQDGYVDLDEFLADVPERHYDRASEWFALIDSNSDDLLTLEELLGEFEDDADENEANDDDADENEADDDDADENEAEDDDADENEAEDDDADENEAEDDDADENEAEDDDADENEEEDEENETDEGDISI